MAMRKYKYVAVNLQKKKIKGTFIAADEKDLAQQLAKQSLFVISAKPYSESVSSFFTLGFGNVSVIELTSFCRQFAIMINTGIPILDCLDILRNQTYSAYFLKTINSVYDDVKGGMVLSQAFDKRSKVFPDFFRSMIYVGEQSGKLEVAFLSLADYYEKDSALKRKTKGAMAYPAFLLLMTIGIVILMFTMVVPSFKKSISTMELYNISGLTKIIFDMSDFLHEYWLQLISGIVIFILIVLLFFLSESGKYVKDWLMVKTPFIKKIQKGIVTARFARAFGLLLSSGMDIAEAMDSVEIILGNRYIKKKFHMAAESVKHGMSLTVAFDSYKLFPLMMIQMIQIGEKTGTLDEVLVRACDFFDVQVETSLNSLIAKIQPTMLIIMGLIIGTMFVAIYSPMITIMNGLNT